MPVRRGGRNGRLSAGQRAGAMPRRPCWPIAALARYRGIMNRNTQAGAQAFALSRGCRINKLKAAYPIGVFDSGVGGLSVLREIRRELPGEDLLYVADSGHAPYGDKSAELIEARAIAITEFLMSQQRQGHRRRLQYRNRCGDRNAAHKIPGAHHRDGAGRQAGSDAHQVRRDRCAGHQQDDRQRQLCQAARAVRRPGKDPDAGVSWIRGTSGDGRSG